MDKNAIDLLRILRQKIARRLHDGPAQSISAVAMRASLMRKRAEAGEVNSADLEALEELARDAASELRQEIFHVKPLVLESEGLARGLQDLVRMERDERGVNVRLQIEEGNWKKVPLDKSEALFFLAADALQAFRSEEIDEACSLALLENGKKLILEIRAVAIKTGASGTGEVSEADFDLNKRWLETIDGGLDWEEDKVGPKLVGWVKHDG